MSWIFGSFRRDALFLMVPGLLALTFARLDLFQQSALWFFIVSAFADSGHVYTTVWRTWFHPTERQRTALHWMIPLGVAVFFFSWSALKFPYMWSIVIYATVHHNWKQYYGITRWYESLNRHAVRWSGTFSKALMILPLIAYHFRSSAVDGFYSSGDVLLYPNETLLHLTLGLYAITFAAWIAFEVQNFKQGYRDANRILSIAFSSTVYAGGFLYGTSVATVLFPIVFGHGLGYMALMSLTLQRTRKSYFASFAKGFSVIALTALAAGAFEYLIERDSINFEPYANSVTQSLVIGLYLIPLFSHFLFDRFLWKHDHWEAKLVYGVRSKTAEIVSLETPRSAPNEQRKSS